MEKIMSKTNRTVAAIIIAILITSLLCFAIPLAISTPDVQACGAYDWSPPDNGGHQGNNGGHNDQGNGNNNGGQQGNNGGHNDQGNDNNNGGWGSWGH
jgi:hypothetical protein